MRLSTPIMLFLGSLISWGCAEIDDNPVGSGECGCPAGKMVAIDGDRDSPTLYPIAIDSLYCRDAEFWRGYCLYMGGLEHEGCEAILSCSEGDTSGVAVIFSDTNWVAIDPTKYSWIRVPQKYKGIRHQRWIHPHYVSWWSSWDESDGEITLYDDPAPPEEIGLIRYPFKGEDLSGLCLDFLMEDHGAYLGLILE